jgi:hypothetical protein
MAAMNKYAAEWPNVIAIGLRNDLRPGEGSGHPAQAPAVLARIPAA